MRFVLCAIAAHPVAAGLIGVASAIFLLAVPPAAPAEHFNYPLSPAAFAVVQIVFCLHH